MEGFKYFVRDKIMYVVIKCDEVLNPVDIAKALKSLIGTIKPQKVIFYKLSVDDSIDKVYAALLQGEVMDGILVQEWDKVEDLYKLLDGIASNQLPTDYLCA